MIENTFLILCGPPDLALKNTKILVIDANVPLIWIFLGAKKLGKYYVKMHFFSILAHCGAQDRNKAMKIEIWGVLWPDLVS